MFQCYASTAVLTCSQQVSAEGACKPENSLNTYEWTSGNVTAAQSRVTNHGTVTITTSNSMPTSSGSTMIVTQTVSGTCSTATCPLKASDSYNKSELIALGAGLGPWDTPPNLDDSDDTLHKCKVARRKNSGKSLLCQRPSHIAGLEHLINQLNCVRRR